MLRQLVNVLTIMTLCFTVSLARAERHEEGGNKSKEEKSSGERSNENKSNENRSNENKSNANKSTGKKPPGGNWSEYNSSGKQSNEQHNDAHNESGAEGAAAGHAAENNKNPQASGAQGAAAGAAAANRNDPAHSGAQGAAAGAAAANRNDPAHSGAQGAAAGAAAANRNEPQYSGAQGAAAGAAAANRNQPAYSGAEGAAAGAAVANRNQPAYSGAEGAAAGAAVANRNQPAMSGAAGAAGYAAVRSNVDHPGMFGPQWYGDHQGAWAPTGWAAGAAWAPATWVAVAGHCGYGNNAPVSYNYGDNVTCIGGNVVVNGQPAGTAEEFSQQADELADAGTNDTASPNDQWLPLGVFALVRNEQQHPQLIMQLAVNQRGIVRGNYTDEVTDTTLPVHGAVDQATQRAAWTVGDNKYSVMEAGLNNLTQGEAPALMHKNGTTQRWLLVRLEQPSQGGN